MILPSSKADTLFSARISDKFGIDSVIVDTVKGTKRPAFDVKDSTNSVFRSIQECGHLHDSLQAAGDSMFYSFRDSTFRLYYNPVVWARKPDHR